MSRRTRWASGMALALGAAALVYWWPGAQPEADPSVASGSPAETYSAAARADGGQNTEREPIRWPSDGPCGHRYVPSRPGEWREYELVSGETEPIPLKLWVTSAERNDGEWKVGWEMQLRGQRYRLTRRCNPHAGAEDPWYGYVPTGKELATASSTWRIPAALETGLEFSGSSELQMPRHVLHPDAGNIAVEVTREYRVTASEVVDTRAGPFEAWRLDFDERRYVDGEPSTVEGTLWLAEGAGLVRAVTREQSMRKEWRLVDLGYDEQEG